MTKKNVQMGYNEKITNFSIFANFLSKNIFIYSLLAYIFMTLYNIGYIILGHIIWSIVITLY